MGTSYVSDDRLRATYTKFNIAASVGDVLTMSKMVNEGVHVNVSFQESGTPLHAAVRSERVDVIEYLLVECGANPKLSDGQGRTAIHEAARVGNLDALKLMVKVPGMKRVVTSRDTNQRCTPLHLACDGGHLDVVRYLTKTNGGINKRDSKGRTALHYAAKEGRTDILAVLLDNGAKIETRLRNRTAFSVATAMNSSLKAIKSLLNRGASTSSIIDYGFTALHLAASADIARELMEHDFMRALRGVKYNSSAARQLLFSKSDDGDTALEFIQMERIFEEDPAKGQDMHDLTKYLQSWRSERLCVLSSGNQLGQERSELSVVRNAGLSHFQSFLVEKINETLQRSELREVSSAIMSYLTPSDMLNRWDQWLPDSSQEKSRRKQSVLGRKTLRLPLRTKVAVVPMPSDK